MPGVKIMRVSNFFAVLAVLSGSATLASALYCGQAAAKGLNELAEGKPEESEEADDDADTSKDASKATDTEAGKTTPAAGTTPKAAADGQAAEEAPKIQSATSKAMANNLYLASSFGWASASRSTGKWKGSGASDITLGYKLPVQLMPKLALWGTYRYAPIAVAGELDGVSYRGVWEGHNFGALGSLPLSDKLNLLGSFELAYVLVYLRPLDNIEAEKKAETNGVLANIGGGADWKLVDKLAAGPRLHIGVGSFTVVQVSGEVSYMF